MYSGHFNPFKTPVKDLLSYLHLTDGSYKEDLWCSALILPPDTPISWNKLDQLLLQSRYGYFFREAEIQRQKLARPCRVKSPQTKESVVFLTKTQRCY